MPFTGLYKLDLDKGAHRVPMAQQSRRVSEGFFSNLSLALYSQYSLPEIGLNPLRKKQSCLIFSRGSNRISAGNIGGVNTDLTFINTSMLRVEAVYLVPKTEPDSSKAFLSIFWYSIHSLHVKP